MNERRCLVPLVVRLRGVPDDERLAEMTDAIARSVAGRLLEANRVIAVRESWPEWEKTFAVPKIRFADGLASDDLQRRVAAAIEAGIARAISGGPGTARSAAPPLFTLARYTPPSDPSAPVTRKPASPPARRRRPARGWRIQTSRDFYTTVDLYSQFFNDAGKKSESQVDLGALYIDLANEPRRVSLWLVQVERAYRFADLEQELATRVTELSQLKDNQELFWVFAVAESTRQKLLAIDPSGVAGQTIPDLSGNSRHASQVHGEIYLLSGARVFLTGMVLPKIKLSDYLRVEREIQFSLHYRDLEFLFGPAPQGFESRFHVSWADFLKSYGDRETILHIFPMEVLRRAAWETIGALVEQATGVGAQQEDSRNWWRLQPLNGSFLGALPDRAKQPLAAYTNSVTRTLSEEDRWAAWQPGWRAAILWANFQVTADQRFAILNKESVQRISSRLIDHLNRFDRQLEWRFQLEHIFSESFTPYSAAAGVRTIFDLVMEELQAREGGRWFNFLFDILDTNQGTLTRAFLEFAFISTNFKEHPRVVLLRGRINAGLRESLRNSYFPDTNAIWLEKKGDKRVGPGEVVADMVADYSFDQKGKNLAESKRAELEKALDAEGKKLTEEIAKGRTAQDYDITGFSNEVLKRAALSVSIKDDDFEKVTITISARIKKIELRTESGLQHYVVTWNYVKKIDGKLPWEDLPGTEQETADYLFDDMLFRWGFGRTGERIEFVTLIIVGIGVVLVAWEVGVVAALVELGGGATLVLSSIVLTEIFTLIHKGRKFTLEDFVWAAIEGYINAVTFRLAGLGGSAIAGRIGTASLTSLVAGRLAQLAFTGVVGGGAGAGLTIFAHGIAGVLLGNSPFPTLGDFVRGMALGAAMGLAGEFIFGPALQAAFRIGGQTALSTIGEAVKLFRENGISPAAYAAELAEGLGALRQRLGQFLEGKSVEAIMSALRERFAELGEALAKLPGVVKQRFDLALFRRIFELGEARLGRLETDGLERLLAGADTGAASMGRDELLFFLNGLARDPTRAQRVLQGLGRLTESRVGELMAKGQLDVFAGADRLLSHLVAHDADLIWDVWISDLFRFRTNEFEAWLGRIAGHPGDQQIFALEVLRRPDQPITSEGVAQALDKGGLNNDVVAGLDRLYGAVNDPALADAIMTGARRDNVSAYLLFLRGLSQDNVNRLADQGILQPLSNAPHVVAYASEGKLDILQTVAAIAGPGRDGVEAALALLDRLNPAQLQSFVELLDALDSSLIGGLARAGQLETLALTPQVAAAVRGDPVLRHLVANAVNLPAAQAAPRLRALISIANSLPVLPETLSRGSEFARGGTSVVFEVTGRPDLLVKTGGGRLPVEAQSLIELEAAGIDTVYAGTRSIEGQTHIALRRIDGVSSKDIVGRVRQPLRSAQNTEIVTQRTIDDLERIYKRLSDDNLNIGDFQFIVRRSDGAVFVNDPVSVTRGSGPSGKIRNIIDRFRKIVRDGQVDSGE
jgi:hypothetical protein